MPDHTHDLDVDFWCIYHQKFLRNVYDKNKEKYTLYRNHSLTKLLQRYYILESHDFLLRSAACARSDAEREFLYNETLGNLPGGIIFSEGALLDAFSRHLKLCSPLPHLFMGMSTCRSARC